MPKEMTPRMQECMQTMLAVSRYMQDKLYNHESGSAADRISMPTKIRVMDDCMEIVCRSAADSAA